MGDERKRRRDESLEPHASCDEPFDPDTFDWEARYESLSRVFHTHRDAYPRGCPEERELRDFVPKAARFNARLRAASSLARSGLDDADATRATNGGGDGPPNLPRRYDPRYKVNAAVLTAPRPELERAARRERLPPAAVDEYRRVLAHYEDFRQRRSLAKLVKLAKDKSKLPIAAEMDAIVRSVREHPVTLIAGDTGCGKSTQVPQYLLRAGFDRVACTQPRRVAATALARRVSHETLNEWGGEIAYKIRFDTTNDGARTRVLFMTEGVLLRQLRADPDLREFDVVVIDEAHERHLNTDLALGLLKRLAERRREFRLVIMSATIDLEMFARYFGGCPAISVPGRLHPIKLTYLNAASAGGRRGDRADEKPQVVGTNPSSMSSSHGRRGFRNRDTGERFERIDPHPYLVLLQRIDSKYPRNERGDLLVFLPGMAEIGAVAEHARPYAAESKRWIILPLHSALSAEEQDKVFDAAPEGVRKCVLSTNVAETSVTIDGVRFVCDSGRHKEMQHDPRSGAGSLQEGWISRASADQRKGRAGRTGPGVCFRLYSEAEYARFQKNTPPEISRANLQGLVLQLKGIAGGSCDPRTFPWLEPPPRDALESATWSLREHGALTSAETLTPLGSLLASLPVDVNAGKLLVLASLFGLTGPATSLAAALAVKSPFARKPGGSAGGGREARFDFESPHGDPFTTLTAYARWLDVRDARRENSRKWCRRMGLEEQRLVEMAKLQRQFSDACEGSGLTRKGGGGDDDDDGGGRRERRAVRHQRDRRRRGDARSAHVRAAGGIRGGPRRAHMPPAPRAQEAPRAPAHRAVRRRPVRGCVGGDDPRGEKRRFVRDARRLRRRSA
uniref:P-loop containing nucleoside triphosphate hydrolase protein n=1 Tax=Micromonas pusilla TaxID=38833 RepID=A0A7S0IG38_MICPS